MPREREDAPWTAGPARVRKLRGPKEGLYYWRAVVVEGGKERVVWAGWGRRNDERLVLAIIDAANEAPEADEGALPSPTVRGLLGTWRAAQEQRHKDGEIRARSLQVYRGVVKHLARGLGDVLLEQLDHDAVMVYVRARRAAAASRTVHQELIVLGSAWTWGRRRGVVPDRDLDLPDIRVEPTREKLTPTRSDVLALLPHLDGWVRLAVLLLYATGARLGEVAYLTWAQVDLERGLLQVAGKTGPRLVPIVPHLARELRSVMVRDPDAYVLGVQPLTTRSRLLDHLETACVAAGVPRITPHGLRRLAVDSLYESGADVGAVATLLGQSPTVALRYYRQARPDTLRRALTLSGLGEVPEGQVIPIPVHHSGTPSKNRR